MRKRRRFAAEHKGEAAERPEESGKILQAVGGELRGRPDRARTRCGSPTLLRPDRRGLVVPGRHQGFRTREIPWSSCAGRRQAPAGCRWTSRAECSPLPVISPPAPSVVRRRPHGARAGPEGAAPPPATGTMPVLSIRHVTTYRYRQPVAFGEHRMMFRPRESHDQRLLEARLEITPEPAKVRWLHDVFGNCVAVARFAGRARELRFESAVRLDHSPSHPLDFELDEHAAPLPVHLPGRGHARPLPLDRAAYPDPDREVDRWARRFLREGGPTGTARPADGDDPRHQARLHLHPAATEKGIQDPARTLRLGSGTCRDFAVLMMEAVRALGLAARFVSGYLYSPGPRRPATWAAARPTPGCRVYLPGAGWVEFDPTNGIVGNRDLVRVAVARDPRQAMPLSGTCTGFASDSLGMTVEVSVSAATPTRRAVAAWPGMPRRRKRPARPDDEQQRPPGGHTDADPRRLRDRLRVPAADADAADAERPSLAAGDLVEPPEHRVRPADRAPATTVDGFGNVCTRIVAPAGRLDDLDRLRDRGHGPPDPVVARRPAARRSRTCPTRRWSTCSAAATARPTGSRDIAWSLFGGTPAGLGARAGDLRLRPRPHHLRLPARPLDPDRLRAPTRSGAACAATSPTWRSRSAAA